MEIEFSELLYGAGAGPGLGMGLRSSYMLGKCSTSEPHLQHA